MAEEWFYAQQGRQLGPVSLDALATLLRNRQVAPTALVWRNGMANWVEARAVPELAPHAPVMPLIDMPQQPTGVQQMQYQTPRGMEFEYAGFWLRVVSAIIDGMILWIPVTFLSGLTDHLLNIPVFRPGPVGINVVVAIRTFANIYQIVIAWLYFALMESSVYQATLGKMALGLIVTDENGGRLTFGLATGRAFGKYLSQLTCLIGYAMAGFTERKQALHDIVAKTLVVRKGVPRQ